MIGKIIKTEDFQNKLIVSSENRQYNSNLNEINIKNKNNEFGNIFSTLNTISNYRIGNINYLAFSGKENVDENGTIINLTFPNNFKEINDIKLIISLDDFEIYSGEVEESNFSKLEILPSSQQAGILEEQSLGSVSSGMYILYGNTEDEIKNYRDISSISNGFVNVDNIDVWINNNKLKVKTTNAKASGVLQTSSNFRSFSFSNITWHDPNPDYYMQQEKHWGGHAHEFRYMANMLDGFDHNHTFVSDSHNHNYFFPSHIHFVDQSHFHNIKFKSHFHNINTKHAHNITSNDLFFKKFSASNIKVLEINKNYSINGTVEINLSEYKSNISNKITIIPNAKCNITYFLLIELYCIDDE